MDHVQLVGQETDEIVCDNQCKVRVHRIYVIQQRDVSRMALARRVSVRMDTLEVDLDRMAVELATPIRVYQILV